MNFKMIAWKRILNILSSLGVQASIEAAKQLNSVRDEKIKVMLRKIQQLDYETNRAFEQYNEVDPKNRLVAAELERRWNEKLKEAERAKFLLSDIENENKSLTEEEEEEKIFEISFQI